MKNALISPDEKRLNGFRVAQVADATFEVAAPLFWVECDDEVEADIFWYDPLNEQITLIPVLGSVTQPISQGAQDL